MFWMHDGTPRRRVDSRVGRFGDSVSILGDEAEVEGCFSPFGDSANLDA